MRRDGICSFGVGIATVSQDLGAAPGGLPAIRTLGEKGLFPTWRQTRDNPITEPWGVSRDLSGGQVLVCLLFEKWQMSPECIKAHMWTIILLIGSNIFMTFAWYGLNCMNALS